MALFTGIRAAFELDGTYKEASGNGYTGTPVGGPTFVAGKIGSAISFAAAQRFQISPTLTGQSIAGAAFSVEVWLKPSSLPASYGVILGSSSSTFGLYLKSNGAMSYFDTTNGDRLSTIGIIGTGSWHHVVFTYGDGGATTFRWYVNGAAAGTGAAGAATSSHDWVGDDAAAVKQYLGQMDMLRVWRDKALSASDVTLLWNGGAGLNFLEDINVVLPNLLTSTLTNPERANVLPFNLLSMVRGQQTIGGNRFSSIYDKPSGGSSKFNPGFN